jgi:hypothetical protein
MLGKTMLKTFHITLALNSQDNVPVDAETIQGWLKSRIEGDSSLVVKVAGMPVMAKFELSIIKVKDG